MIDFRHILVAAAAVAFLCFSAARADTDTIDFERKPTFAFGSFDKAVAVEGGALRLTTPNGRGGAGFQRDFNLSGPGDRLPMLRVTVGPANKARKVFVEMKDASDNLRSFEYLLADAQRGTPTALTPRDAESLSPPDGAFDPSQVVQLLVKGDWGAGAYDLTIDGIDLVPPTPEQVAVRQERAEALRAEQEKQARLERERIERRERLLRDGADHPADGPRVAAVSAVGPSMLAVRLVEGEYVPGGQRPYEPRKGDKVMPDGGPVLAWQDGRPAIVPKGRKVMREREGGGGREQIGTLLADGETLQFDRSSTGTAITADTLDAPAAYVLRSQDDPAYSGGVEPVEAFRKSKPIARQAAVVEHWVYLKLPSPLTPGGRYTLEFRGVNTAEPSTEFVYDSTQTWSPAVQATHVGHRPGDPFKRAFLSEWLGTGGAYTFDVDHFELLDESGEVAFTGDVKRVLAADESENLTGEGNRTGTNVYALDYADFTTPGTYRVHVPGVGVSRPFPIADGVWESAFEIVMKGLLVHRSGIALPAELVGDERPTPMRPGVNGFRVLQTDVTIWDGESKAIDESLRRLLGESMDASGLEELPQAWGGYMDAGDWDRRSIHLTVADELMELYGLFPDYFADLKLALPDDEAANDVPDLLDEARWAVDFYQRIQRDDGGVRGGVESTQHPRAGEASWQESLLVGAFLPDPESSYRFAGSAARLARLIEPFDADAAEQYLADAERAWDWAEANAESAIEAAKARGVDGKGLAGKAFGPKPLAAVELYHATGDAKYHDAFKAVSVLAKDTPGDGQLDAGFAYALLPDDLADAALKRKAIAQAVTAADAALAFGEGNAYGISHRVANLPMMGWVAYYSVPEAAVGPALPRAHSLTGDDKYLAAALRATNYAVGANPSNMTMTTGLGHDYPRFPLHVDSGNANVSVPVGIPVYGPHDPTRAPGYVKQFTLEGNLVPDVADWPPAESYVDVGNWVEMNEYTVHQTVGPTVYYWGYLAACRTR